MNKFEILKIQFDFPLYEMFEWRDCFDFTAASKKFSAKKHTTINQSKFLA